MCHIRKEGCEGEPFQVNGNFIPYYAQRKSTRNLGSTFQVLLPANRCAIKRVRSVRQENGVLPGSENPSYSLFPASLNHDRMIGRLKSPGNAGGLVGRHTLSCRKTGQGGGGMPKLFVGIDVAKDMSSAQGIDSDGKGLFSLTFTMD